MFKLFGGVRALLGVKPHELDYLFDRGFYLAKNPDVVESGTDPLVHYTMWGWREGRDPNVWFSTAFYLEQVPDLADADVCPLVHYHQTGRALGIPTNQSEATSPAERQEADPRAPARAASSAHSWIDRKNLVLGGQIRELLSALGYDAGELNLANHWSLILKMFSPKHYRRTKGIKEPMSAVELFTRYVLFDLPVGTSPGPIFDADWYAAQISKHGLPQPAEDEGLFLHWLVHGIAARIVPNPYFDPAEYLALNPDLKDYPSWLFEHWVSHGIEENRGFFNSVSLAGGSAAERVRVKEFVFDALATPEASQTLVAMREFRSSDEFREILSSVYEYEPAVGDVTQATPAYMAPFHDSSYQVFSKVRDAIPKGTFTNLVLMPFCKLGGADYVAGVLTRSLEASGAKTLVLRTEQSDWERPDWFPDDVATVDLSKILGEIAPEVRQRILYEVIRHLRPARTFNVNSRLGFEVFERFGERMSLFTNLYCYFFCADRTKAGVESGYPVWYFASLIPNLAGALVDTKDLAQTLCDRYGLSAELRSRVHTIYTPTSDASASVPIVEAQVASSARRRRPVVLWAGRFDRQKRFDLVLEIAARMPDVDFHCWGKAVLDAPPDLSDIPDNVTVHNPFSIMDDLPLESSDLWLYTSSWDGMPTILIECASRGLPVVASAVGGVPELIDEATGWPLDGDAEAGDYARALYEALSDPGERAARAAALQARVRSQHSQAAYLAKLAAIFEPPCADIEVAKTYVKTQA